MIVQRMFTVFVLISPLWLGILVLVQLGRGWARILAMVMVGPSVLATMSLWAWSMARGGMPGVPITLPEDRGYRPSDGVVFGVSVHCGLTVGLLVTVVVLLFVSAVNRHMRAMAMFREARGS